jgi:predicted tellurium resistance membrane protein TerC
MRRLTRTKTALRELALFMGFLGAVVIRLPVLLWVALVMAANRWRVIGILLDPFIRIGGWVPVWLWARRHGGGRRLLQRHHNTHRQRPNPRQDS